MRKRKSRRRKLNQGGLAIGPKHSQGGIPGIIKPTGQPIEFEGGEYIMRASSVKKYGEGAMARINQGLANVSAVRSLKRGGKIMKRRMRNFARGGQAIKRKMTQGGRARKRFQTGGHTHETPFHQHQLQVNASGAEATVGPGGYMVPTTGPLGMQHEWYGDWRYSAGDFPQFQYMSTSTPGTHGHRPPHRQPMKRGGRIRGRRMQMGGRTNCPPGQYRQGGRCVPSGGYRYGGRINRTRKMQSGGRTNRTRKMQSGGIASAANMNYSQLSKKV